MSKLGLTVKFGPAYSLWSNGVNKRKPASTDLTIKKLVKEKKVPLSDSLIKAASWTHNTSMNKLGYSLLQLVTGKAVTSENLTRIVAEFHEADMRQKLKECQNI